jgi:hypothetical protein
MESLAALVHQHVSVKADMEAVGEFGEEFEEVATVAIVCVDGPALDAAGGGVIPSAGLDDAKGSGHDLDQNRT